MVCLFELEHGYAIKLQKGPRSLVWPAQTYHV